LADDLGGIEDFIHAAAELDSENLQDDHIAHEEQVIEVDALSDDYDGIMKNQLLPDLNHNQEVDVFIPLDGDVPLQLIPDEIQEEDLLGSPVHIPVSVDIAEPDQDVMQLGFVEVFQPAADPGFVSHQNSHLAHSSEVIRQWAKHFAPGPGSPIVQVPLHWSPLFTAMLLNPGNFYWAKAFLESSALDIFSKSLGPSRPFALPPNCPSVSKSSCMLDSIDFDRFEDQLPKQTNSSTVFQSPEAQSSQPSTPASVQVTKKLNNVGPWSKAVLAKAGKLKLNADDPELRRSLRRKNLNKGYKDPCCSDKSCIACFVNQPTISPSVITNLCVTFCKIDAQKLTDEALFKKKKATVPRGKKPRKSQGKGDDAAKPDKKKAKK